MKRYITLRRAQDINLEPDAEQYLSRIVFEADSTPYATGILDPFGEPLYAVIELDPVGFVRWTD